MSELVHDDEKGYFKQGKRAAAVVCSHVQLRWTSLGQRRETTVSLYLFYWTVISTFLQNQKMNTVNLNAILEWRTCYKTRLLVSRRVLHEKAGFLLKCASRAKRPFSSSLIEEEAARSRVFGVVPRWNRVHVQQQHPLFRLTAAWTASCHHRFSSLLCEHLHSHPLLMFSSWLLSNIPERTLWCYLLKIILLLIHKWNI